MISPERMIANVPMLRRVIPSYLKRYARAFKHRFVVERRMGALFLLDQKNAVDRNLLTKGTWEPRQLDELRRQIRALNRDGEDVVFLDIGAHGALYSIVLAAEDLVGRIVAFEPDPTNLIQLKANLFINGMLERIEVIEKAASNEKGQINFYPAEESNRGSSGTILPANGTQLNEITVDADRTDDLVAVSNSLLVVKIDVEGGEQNVLMGMENSISRNRCLFQIECFEETFPAVLAWLEKHDCRYLKTIDFDHFFYKG